MTPPGVHQDDMFSDDPTIAAFARDLQDAAAASPAPAVGVTLATVLSGQAPALAYPEVHAPHGRGRVVRRSTRARWAVAGAAFGLGAGSLGVAGALPAPVQRQVARMAEVVGIDLPDGQDSPTTTITVPEPETTTTVPTTSTTLPTTTTVDPVTAGDDGSVLTTTTSGEDDNSGHGNEDDRDDVDNPGNGNGHGGTDDGVDDQGDDDQGDDDQGVDDQGEDDGSGAAGRGNASVDDERADVEDDHSGPDGGNAPDDDNDREED